MRPSKRNRIAAWFVSMVALIAVLAHNSVTLDTSEPTNPNAPQGTVEYGWPMKCFRGSISTEKILYATVPRQHWVATQNGRVVWAGLLVNALVVAILVFAIYRSVVWTLNSFDAKLTVATLFGLLTFVALLFAHEAVDKASLVELFPQMRNLLIETYLLQYLEKLVWVFVFIACLWWPNFILGTVQNRKSV